MVNCVTEKIEEASLEHLLFLLKFGRWDVVNFHAFFYEMRKKLPLAGKELQERVAQALHGIWDNFYESGTIHQAARYHRYHGQESLGDDCGTLWDRSLAGTRPLRPMGPPIIIMIAYHKLS